MKEYGAWAFIWAMKENGALKAVSSKYSKDYQKTWWADHLWQAHI